jgi:NADH-quinone oxidoreductase subunit A
MSDAVSSSVAIVAYLALFSGVAIVFLLANLVVGRFVRPADPHPEKLEIYECGEPTIGSSFVQFDLRFYVVALLFIIFDVEIAFFFPWATVFGKSTHLRNERMIVAERVEGKTVLSHDAELLYRELGVRRPTAATVVPASLVPQISEATNEVVRANRIAHQGAAQLAWVTIVDILAFFGVLMVGFLYVWKRGDLDWVRAVGQERAQRASDLQSREPRETEPALSV